METREPQSVNCVFCDIVAGEAEHSIVHEDDNVLVFMDTKPIMTGHVLVIPKKHATYLENLDADVGAEMFRTAHLLALALPFSGLPCDGVNFFLANREAAFQRVFHVHLHVFPRVEGDGFHFQRESYFRNRRELDQTATVLRRSVARLVRGSGR